MAWMALWAALAAAQQDQTVFRTEKGEYPQAIRECQAAEGLLESDPRGAIEKLDAILANPRIRKVECRIRIEERPAEYSPWTLFLPYQFRGRARMNLAKKSEREAAEKLLAGAAEDFQKSLDAGVKSSEEYLKAAKEELQRVRLADASAPADPLTRFAPGFQQLLRLNKFKAARDYVDAEGRELTDAQRKAFVEECARRSALFAGEQVEDFRRRLARLTSLRDLQEMAEAAFAGLFEFPPAEQFMEPDPVMAWGRAHAAAFAEVRSGRAGGEALLPAAAAAAGLVSEGANPWFSIVENLAFQGVRDGVRSAAEKARDADRAGREALRARAEGLLKPWREFAAAVEAKHPKRAEAVKRHSEELAEALKGFPVELEELDRVDLEACFADPAPLAKLKEQEVALQALEAGKVVSLESRRKLYAAIVTAAALRLLAEGRSEAEAAQSLQAYGAPLKAAGALPADAARFGPRVQKVFQELTK